LITMFGVNVHHNRLFNANALTYLNRHKSTGFL
jgi:hypothetical protein